MAVLLVLPINDMMLPPRRNRFAPANLALASAGVLGTTQYNSIDRTWPLEEIDIICDVTCGGTGPTPTGVDGLTKLIKNVNLTINDGVQPRTIINMSGQALLEYMALSIDSLDRSTLDLLGLQAQGALAANTQFRLTYTIPLVHPLATEPLRTYMLLPIHTYPQDPVLAITFETGANLYSAGSFSNVQVSYVLKRRQMSVAQTAMFQKVGFIGFDLQEQAYSIGTGVSGEQRFQIPTPGSYANLCFRQYLGGGSVTRNTLDQVATFGAESKWHLESGGVTPVEWRWKDLQIENDRRRSANGVSDVAIFVAATSAGSPTKNAPLYPNFPPNINSATNRWDPEATVLLDFLSPDGDSVNELGSVLDCNLPTNTGLKMELVGPVSSVATNASTLYVCGHRYFGDLSYWQALKT